ncbi:MAG TPA: LysR substrate-binding domain-containing protein [Burkholderiaceae bacterium]|nr:LysR substrate-binding domain-containing protein [Burkholderiaceae bacterium]
MNKTPHRPLDVGALRSFEAVARRLSFSAAAEELFLTQPAISRQIKALEADLGAPLFLRGTRRVELTQAGAQLQRAVLPLLQRLDGTVRQIRSARGRRHVAISTFASFASLWLLPRLAEFERAHPDIDLRISATDTMVDLDDTEIDLVLRYCAHADAPRGATLLFDETITPAAGRALLERIERGLAPPLTTPNDLAAHALLDDDDPRPSGMWTQWGHWLRQRDLPHLEPQRWLHLNYTYQKVQATLAGQGVALLRLPLIVDALERGELVEPFGVDSRVAPPFGYWLMRTAAAGARAEVALCAEWLAREGVLTRDRALRVNRSMA